MNASTIISFSVNLWQHRRKSEKKQLELFVFNVCFFAFILFVWYCALFCDEIKTSV